MAFAITTPAILAVDTGKFNNALLVRQNLFSVPSIHIDLSHQQIILLEHWGKYDTLSLIRSSGICEFCEVF